MKNLVDEEEDEASYLFTSPSPLVVDTPSQLSVNDPSHNNNNNNNSSTTSPQSTNESTSNSDISSVRSDSKTSSPLNNSLSPSKSSPSKKKPSRKKYVKRACVNCKQSHAACDSERPCKRCKSLGMEDKCVDAIRKKSKNDSIDEKNKKQKTEPSPSGTNSNAQFPFYHNNMMDNNLMTQPSMIGTNQMLMIPMLTTTTTNNLNMNTSTSSTTINNANIPANSNINAMKPSNVVMIPFQPSFFPMNHHAFKNDASMLHLNYPPPTIPTIPPPILSKSNNTPTGLQSSFSAFSNSNGSNIHHHHNHQHNQQHHHQHHHNSTNTLTNNQLTNVSTSIISSGNVHSPFLPPSSPLDFLSETHSPVITNFPEFPSHPSPSPNNITTNNVGSSSGSTAAKDQDEVVDIITQEASLLKSQIEKKNQDDEIGDQLELFNSNEISNLANEIAENPSEFMRNNAGNATLEDLVVLMWKKQVAQTQEIKDLKQLVSELKTIIRQSKKDNNNQ